MEDLERRLKEMIVERLFLPVDPATIEDEDPLMEKYDIDSVALFEVIVGLEQDFDISLSDAEFRVDLFKNVASIADFVRSKSGED